VVVKDGDAEQAYQALRSANFIPLDRRQGEDRALLRRQPAGRSRRPRRSRHPRRRVDPGLHRRGLLSGVLNELVSEAPNEGRKPMSNDDADTVLDWADE